MAEQPPVTQVWTDFGGVLTPPVHVSLAKFCAANGLTQDEFMGAVQQVSAAYGTTDILEPLDTPMVDEQAWLQQVSAALGRPVGVRSFGEAWFDDRPANHEWVETLRALRRRGVGVSLMSNMVPTWDEHWRRMVDADELFDHVVLSFDSCGACTNCRAAHPAYCAEFFARNLSGLAVDGSTPAAGEDGKPVAARWFAQSSFASHAVVTVRNVVRVDPDLPCHSCSSRASSTCGNGAGSRSTDSSPGTRSTRSTRPKPTPPAERPSNPY